MRRDEGRPLAVLLSATAGGDQAAMGALYDALATRVLLLVRTVVADQAGVDRAVSDAFVAVWRLSPRYDPRAHDPTVWILQIAYDCALEHRPPRRAEAAADTGDEGAVGAVGVA